MNMCMMTVEEARETVKMYVYDLLLITVIKLSYLTIKQLMKW